MLTRWSLKFLKINRKTPVSEIFLFNIVAGLWPANFIKKEALVQVFSYEFCKISKNIFLQRTPLMAASELNNQLQWFVECSWRFAFVLLTSLLQEKEILEEEILSCFWTKHCLFLELTKFHVAIVSLKDRFQASKTA